MLIANWNQPGYLPEGDGAEFDGDDWESAVDFLADEIESALENDDFSDSVIDASLDEFRSAAQTGHKIYSVSWSAPDGYVYWISNESDDDDSETIDITEETGNWEALDDD